MPESGPLGRNGFTEENLQLPWCSQPATAVGSAPVDSTNYELKISRDKNSICHYSLNKSITAIYTAFTLN